MTDNDERAWRDEERLPLAELDQAVARSASDGEVDDVTGEDAGAESAFGHGAEAQEPDQQRSSRPSPDPSEMGGPEMSGPTDPQRAQRPSTTGRTGPN